MIAARIFLVVAAVASAVTHAQSYPSRPVEVVVHTSPGGGTDLFGRNVSDMLSRDKAFATGFVVSNRTGGLGSVAFNYIKSKRGDPHVLLTVATGSLLTAASRPELGLGLENYTPLAFFAQDPQAIAVRAESKIMTMRDLVEAAKREPLTAAMTTSVGVGRYCLVQLERETGAKFKIVTFKGGGEAVLATLGGHVEVTTENLSEMISLYETKKMRVLAVTGERRFARAPDIPTLKELGYNIIAATGRGFAMPAGVPKEAAAAMEAALKRVHDSPAYKDYADRNIFEDKYLGSAEFRDYLVKRREELQDFLKQVGVVK
jgi:putative tricarboxylic transport membrane protein